MPKPRRPSQDEIRRRSKDLFRNAYMLEVCVGIARAEDRVNLSGLLKGSELAPSLYSGPLRRLAGLGLLLDDSRPTDDYRERWYKPTKSHLWVATQELVKA